MANAPIGAAAEKISKSLCILLESLPPLARNEVRPKAVGALCNIMAKKIINSTSEWWDAAAAPSAMPSAAACTMRPNVAVHTFRPLAPAPLGADSTSDLEEWWELASLSTRSMKRKPKSSERAIINSLSDSSWCAWAWLIFSTLFSFELAGVMTGKGRPPANEKQN